MAQHLSSKGDHRAVVQLVEKWADHGEPTPAARILEARAFLELRQLDRAWVRLKDLVEGSPPRLEALALATEMFLLRGWPNQARKTVQKALELEPQSTVFKALLDRLSESPSLPDETAIEADATPVADLIAAAEQFLAQGAAVRARTLLERVRRKVPDHRWASDLLWALDGDFTSGVAPLHELADRLGPDLTLLTEIPDEPEHTESASRADLHLQVENDSGFPSLFRNLDAQTDAYGSEEVTAVSAMASLGDLDTLDPGEHTDPGGDDTQIMRVVHKGEDGKATEVDGKFNLAEFRREMGVPAPDLGDFRAGPEDEDDSVVIVTRREDTTDGGPDPTTDVGGLKLDLASEQEAKRLQGTLEDASWARTGAVTLPPEAAPARTSTATPPPSAPRTTPPKPKAPPSPKPTPRAAPLPAPLPSARLWPWWVAAMATLLGLAVVVFGFIAILAALG